jgi:hypothetical protein
MANPLPNVETAPPPHVAGEVRVHSWRRVWVVTGAGPLTCSPDPAAAHRFHDTDLVWEHGCLRCKHKVTRGGAECGRLIYLVGGGLVNPQGRSLIILCEVAAAEMRHMHEARLGHDAALEYLGIRLPG